MQRFKAIIEYDGTSLAGFQRQKTQPSVQQYIEEALENLVGSYIKITAAGRTDAGVHAMGQVIHFDLEKELQPINITRGINYYLKQVTNQIAIKSTIYVSNDFHARYSAKSRSYEYHILCSDTPSPLKRDRVWFVRHSLDIDKMQQAANYLISTRDFTSFRSSICQAKSSIKTIKLLSIIAEKDIIKIKITADSFLHHMVRNIVGTLVLIGNSKISLEKFIDIVESKNRNLAGITAPPQGLYLSHVDYDI